MGLTNVLILECITVFPAGWLLGGFYVLLVGKCCWCLNKYVPSILPKLKDPITIYKLLYETVSVVVILTIWSGFSSLLLTCVMIYVYLYE
jgi:hypothetical protein